MSDRVLVMREGRQMGIFAGADLEQERIMMAAVGVGVSDAVGSPPSVAAAAPAAPVAAGAGCSRSG